VLSKAPAKLPAGPSGRERDLAARCRRGDRAALSDFFREYTPVVERLLGRLVGSSPILEDLVQTTFLEALKTFHRFRGEASLATWVSRIAVHVAHHHFREKSRRPVTLEVIGPGEEPMETKALYRGGDTTPSLVADRRRIGRRLLAVLDRLSAKKRVAFVLHAIEGYSVDEVAALMDSGRAATRSRLWFARREIDAMIAADPVLRQASIELDDGVEEAP
jgi:RNA polymerase sigma-70 factor, ECF subfamily